MRFLDWTFKFLLVFAIGVASFAWWKHQEAEASLVAGEIDSKEKHRFILEVGGRTFQADYYRKNLEHNNVVAHLITEDEMQIFAEPVNVFDVTYTSDYLEYKKFRKKNPLPKPVIQSIKY